MDYVELPYVFDLIYDIKDTEDLYNYLKQASNDMGNILELMKSEGIATPKGFKVVEYTAYKLVATS